MTRHRLAQRRARKMRNIATWAAVGALSLVCACMGAVLVGSMIYVSANCLAGVACI